MKQSPKRFLSQKNRNTTVITETQVTSSGATPEILDLLNFTGQTADPLSIYQI